MEKKKMEKGITLVALVITIIVLLILAVVTIAAVTNTGILTLAENAVDAYKEGEEDESERLQSYADIIEEKAPVKSDAKIIKFKFKYEDSREDIYDPDSDGFTISSTYKTIECEAEEGMSLKKWLNSSYNKISAYIEERADLTDGEHLCISYGTTGYSGTYDMYDIDDPIVEGKIYDLVAM